MLESIFYEDKFIFLPVVMVYYLIGLTGKNSSLNIGQFKRMEICQ